MNARFFPDDVLVLTLVDKRQDDYDDGEDARSCLAIMEREDRGAGGSHRNSLKVRASSLPVWVCCSCL